MASDHEEEGLEPESFLAARAYIEGQWREAMDKAQQVMDVLRSIHPDLSHALGESGSDKIGRTLNTATQTYAELHELGYYVLGEERYKAFLDQMTLERVRNQET